MTTTLVPRPVRWTARVGRFLGPLANIWAMARRNLVHISREPMQLSDVTIQPVLFTFLFVFIFGGAIPIPGGGSYKDYLLAGILALNLVTSVMGTAVGLVDRPARRDDRPLPGPAHLATVRSDRPVGGRFHDVVLCALIVGLTGLVVGLAVGRRRFGHPGRVLDRPLLRLLVDVGRPVRGVECQEPGVRGLVRIHRAVPAGLRLQCHGADGAHAGLDAGHRRLESGLGGCRGTHLWNNPNPSHVINAWPMQHPVEASLIWTVVIIAVAAPMASYFFNKRCTD